MRLSIVIVGRNEEKRIAACIKSVIKGSETIPDREIVFIDSSSTDRTVEIAGKFPIGIIQIPDDRPLSASAGRYVGTLYTRGEYIFFIDGDTVLYRKWLSEAMHRFEGMPLTAGLAGMVHVVIDGGNGNSTLIRNRYGQTDPETKVKTLGGIALYRRSALEEAGSFNPFIKVDEEPELALRLQRLGFNLIRTDKPMAVTHYEHPMESLSEYLRRRNSHLYDYGITLRCAKKNGLFWRYAFERLSHIWLFLTGLTIGGCILWISIIKNRLDVLSMAILLCMVFFLIWRKGNIRGIGLSIVKRTLMTERTFITYIQSRSLLTKEYPTEIEKLKEGSIHA